MNIVDKVIKIASDEVGYLEKKSNSNLYNKIANAGYGNYTKYAHEFDTKYVGFYNGKKNGYAYCDVFVDWCFVQAYGVETAKKLLCQPNKSYGASCTYSSTYYKNKGRFHTKDPKVGDQIFFLDSSKRSVVHTGLVYHVDKKYVYTIEGNTSGASGVVANGGGVCRKQYALSYSRIYGYGRPNYDKSLLEVDGSWGKETTKACQKYFGTTQDGIVSGQSSANKKYLSAVSTSSWKFTIKKYGSDMIRAMQKMLGVKADGLCGKGTIIALQKFLKDKGYYTGSIDGLCGNGTVKALQNFLNENL